MKKDVILFGLFILVFVLPFAAAQTNTTMKNNARDCITDKVNNRTCSAFGLEDKIFSLLSVNKCESEVLNSSQNGKCWGLSGCTLKTTSQAILALDESSTNTDDYVDWLLAQNITSTGLDWLIQIESPEATNCDIYDSDNNLHQISIDAEKKISSISGTTCLSIDSTGYWLGIKPSCYDKSFDISCDKAFLTGLLFRKQASSIIHVLEGAQQSTAGGTLSEKMGSLCFKSGSLCDYEGTLWATFVLNKLGHDVSSYFPYLIAFEEDNEALFPESFLYILTSEEDFFNELILKQKREKYWDEKGGVYYDTATALMSFPSTDIEAKQNSLNWLASEQSADGCWDSGSIAHTGFLIYSLWGSVTGGSGGPGGPGNYTPLDDCEDSNYYCISDIECANANGNELAGYTGCSGAQICCDKDVPSQTCAELGGTLCDDETETCNGNEDYTAEDYSYSQTCCIGTCTPKPPAPDDTCTPEGYACKDTCDAGETSTYDYTCTDSSQYCCKPESPGPPTMKWWIWALIALIILIIIAIIFKNKLREFFLRSKLKKKPGPPFPPRISGMPPSRPMPPRMPLQQRQIPPRRVVPPARSRGEMDDVLKKLKEMGK